MNVRPIARERREQWTRRLLGLQVRANELVKLGDFREAQQALRISRRAYDHWARECFKRPQAAAADGGEAAVRRILPRSGERLQAVSLPEFLWRAWLAHAFLSFELLERSRRSSSMRLQELRDAAQQALDEQGELTAADWLWLLAELAALAARDADGLYGILEVQGRRVVAWWCS